MNLLLNHFCLPLGEHTETKGAKETELLKRFMTELLCGRTWTDLTVMETLFFSQVSLHFSLANKSWKQAFSVERRTRTIDDHDLKLQQKKKTNAVKWLSLSLLSAPILPANPEEEVDEGQQEKASQLLRANQAQEALNQAQRIQGSVSRLIHKKNISKFTQDMLFIYANSTGYRLNFDVAAMLATGQPTIRKKFGQVFTEFFFFFLQLVHQKMLSPESEGNT